MAARCIQRIALPAQRRDAAASARHEPTAASRRAIRSGYIRRPKTSLWRAGADVCCTTAAQRGCRLPTNGETRRALLFRAQREIFTVVRCTTPRCARRRQCGKDAMRWSSWRHAGYRHGVPQRHSGRSGMRLLLPVVDGGEGRGCGGDHCTGGCQPACAHRRRATQMRGRFIRRRTTVARPVCVRPTI